MAELSLEDKVTLTFYTLDNGINSFKTQINYQTKHINVFKRHYWWKHVAAQTDPKKTELVWGEHYNELVLSSDYSEIFIGKSPECEMTSGIKTYGAIYDGNSIIFKDLQNQHYFIGWKLFKFNLKENDTIIGLESPVGNNDVPYPTAIGKNYLYLMSEEACILKDDLLTLGWTEDYLHSDNLYYTYYGHEKNKTLDRQKFKTMDIEVIQNSCFELYHPAL